MTEGQYYPPAGPPAPDKKPSLWQRFKRWPLIAKIGTIGCGGLIALFALIMVLGLILTAVDPEGVERRAAEREEREAAEAEEEAERQAEEEAEREAEEEAAREAEEEAAAAEEEEEPDPEPTQEPTEEETQEPEPQTLEEQVQGLADIESFEDADITVFEPNELTPYRTVQVYYEVEDALFASGICFNGQSDTIDALEFMRDEVSEEYGEFQISGYRPTAPDATGDSSNAPVMNLAYDASTVEAIDSDSVHQYNVWDAANPNGMISSQCD